MARNLSRQERNSWYVPGKTSVEKQHVNEHQTLQTLQKYALNGKREEFYELLETIDVKTRNEISYNCVICKNREMLLCSAFR